MTPELMPEATRKAIAAKIINAIEAACIEKLDEGFRSHLGASLMGSKCNRYLWYSWRWVQKEKFKSPSDRARMLRLFQRGHKEEPHLVSMLMDAGLTVWEVDPTTGKQFRISDHEGHFGGSCDGQAALPASLGYGSRLLLEFKTHNTKSFVHLKANGVRKSKPQHFAQMCQYGARMGLKYALYMAVNKNDDDLHIEIIELDWGYGEDLIKRGGDIIATQEPPPRLHETSTHIDCKWCPMVNVCHEGEPYERNCRSCQHAYPSADKQWACGLFKQIIPADFIPNGCDRWHPIGRK